MSINTVDILILLIVILWTSLGLLTGVVWQIAGVVSLVAGIVATLLFGDTVSLALQRWIADASLAGLVAHIGVFMLTSLTVRTLAMGFGKMLEKAKLKALDRVLGGGVGLLKGIALSAVLIVILSRTGTEASQSMVGESVLAVPVIELVDMAMAKADEANVTERGRQMIGRFSESGTEPDPAENPDAPTPPSESDSP